MNHFKNPISRSRRSESEDESEDGSMITGHPKLGFTRTIPVRQHDFYLYSPIGAPMEYLDLIHTIRTAEPHDQINLHLSTPGGQLDTGIAIISAIAECQGTITTVLDSEACSMGAILFLAGHQYIVHDCSMLMFHTFSGGFMGKSSDVDNQVQAYKRQYNMLVKKTCSRFLTMDEIKRIENGEEMWFNSDVISKRLRVLTKQINAENAPKPIRKSKKGAVTMVDDTLTSE